MHRYYRFSRISIVLNLALAIIVGVSGCGSKNSISEKNLSTPQENPVKTSSMLTDDICLEMSLYALEAQTLVGKAKSYLGENGVDPISGDRIFWLVGDKGKRISSRIEKIVIENNMTTSNDGKILNDVGSSFDALMEALENEDKLSVKSQMTTLQTEANLLEISAAICEIK